MKVSNKKIDKLGVKSILIFQELINNPEGLRVTTLKKLTNMTERTIYRHLNKLKEVELIKNIYPIWKIAISQGKSLKLTKLLKGSKIEVHDFSFIIRLIKTPTWWERRNNKLMKLKEFQFKKEIDWGNNKYIQLTKDQFLIQIYSTSIIFMLRKKYYGNDSYDCLIEALKDFLDMNSYLEELFNFKFFPDGIPNVSIRSHHFVRLRDAISKRCKKRGKGFNISIDGKLRVWVDLSDPIGTECGHRDYAPEDMRNYDKQIVDFVKNNPPTNTELTQNLNVLTERTLDLTKIQATESTKWGVYAGHIDNHTKAIIRLGELIDQLSKQLKRMEEK